MSLGGVGRRWPSRDKFAARAMDPRHKLLVLAALGPSETAGAAYEQWRSGIDLETLDAASVRLLPHLSHRLEADPEDRLARSISRSLRVTWLRTETTMRSATPALRALAEREIPALLGKGAAVVHHTGVSPARRPMNDVDICVPLDRVTHATHGLIAAGFDCELAPLLGNHPEQIVTAINGVGFKDSRQAAVDLHWHMLHHRRHPDADRWFWEGSQAHQFHDVPCRITSPADTLLHVVAHGSLWDDSEALYWMADAMLLIEAGEIDWERLLAHARRLRLERMLWEGLSHVRDLGADVPASVIERLAAERVAWPEDLLRAAGNVPGRVGTTARALLGGLERELAPAATPGPSDLAAAVRDLGRGTRGAPPAALPVVELNEIVAATLRGDGTGCPHLTAGWHYPEPHGTWSRERLARIVLPLAEPADGPLLLEAQLSGFVAAARPRLELDVLLEGRRRLVTWPFQGAEPRAQTCVALIPARPGRRMLDLVLRVRHPGDGELVGWSGDPRTMGVALSWLRVTRAERRATTGHG